MTDPFKNMDANKRLCTGAPLDYQTPPDLAPACDSEADFDFLVSTYYQLYRERLRDDISFLRSVRNHRHLTDFDNAIYLLRTAKQHDDNARANEFYTDWTTTYNPWQISAEMLTESFAKAIQHLEAVSSFVRRDPKLAAAWREQASAEPEAIFLAVCGDLRVQFSSGNRQRLVRNVRARLSRTNTKGNVRAAIEDLCAQEVTSQLRSLPVPYFEVLDRLDLIGKPGARAALLVAYSIEAATNLRGEEFLIRVEETWKVARA